MKHIFIVSILFIIFVGCKESPTQTQTLKETYIEHPNSTSPIVVKFEFSVETGTTSNDQIYLYYSVTNISDSSIDSVGVLIWRDATSEPQIKHFGTMQSGEVHMCQTNQYRSSIASVRVLPYWKTK